MFVQSVKYQIVEELFYKDDVATCYNNGGLESLNAHQSVVDIVSLEIKHRLVPSMTVLDKCIKTAVGVKLLQPPKPVKKEQTQKLK